MIQTVAELDRVREDCRQLVTKRAMTAAATSMVPIPGLDLIADVGLLTKLLPDISARFGLSEAQVRKLDPHLAERVLVMASGLGNTMIGRAVTKRVAASLLKRVGARLAAGSVARFVPFAGTAVAASIGFGAMKMAGNAHVEDCYRTALALIANDVRR
jgi:uncharacterized protein (DUF697 family)